MQHSPVICTLVTCLLLNCKTLAQLSLESVQTSSRNVGSDTRMRRSLLFEKGAALSITASAVKSIISGVPRGLNLICEDTVYYDLPSSVSEIQPVALAPLKAPLTQQQMKRKLLHLRPEYFPQYRYKRNGQSRENLTNDDFKSLDIEALFFEQIERLAETYGFNGRHCAMRTICEAQHYLYPKGQSLFHDVIRIIVQSSMLVYRYNRKYLAASKVVDPMECANLYGPHCRISFIKYVTKRIHGNYEYV